jgi:hypothetical protein
MSSTALKTPLDAIVSNKKSSSTKIISGVAVGVLTVFSLGVYGVYTYRYFSNRKVGLLQQTLEEKAKQGDIDGVKELFRKYPLLKRRPDLKLFTGQDDDLKSRLRAHLDHRKSKSHISRMLESVAEQGNLEIVKLLCENGACVDGDVDAPIPIPLPLKNAFAKGHFGVAKYLIDKSSKISPGMLMAVSAHTHNSRSRCNSSPWEFSSSLTPEASNTHLDFMHFLVGKMAHISPKESISKSGKHWIAYDAYWSHRNSMIDEIAEKYYQQNPEKSEKIIRLLLAKGDRPMCIKEKDEKACFPEAAQRFINSLAQASR